MAWTGSQLSRRLKLSAKWRFSSGWGGKVLESSLVVLLCDGETGSV